MARMAVSSPSGLDSNRIRTKRVTTGSIAGGGVANVVITWDTPLSDTNYTASATVAETATPGTTNLRVEKIGAITSESITVRVANSEAITARTGVIHATAIAD